VQLPGVSNAWTMPIKGRTDMLSTGIRTPVGIKVLGRDAREIERIRVAVEAAVRAVPGTRSAYAERTAAGYFIDVEPRREQLARYGLTLRELHGGIICAIGGENITTASEGRERYPVNLRYPRELRDDPDRLAEVLVPTPAGTPVPLREGADVRIVQGPSMLRDENGFLAGYVYVDISGRDLGAFVARARRAVAAHVVMPPAYSLVWSGQFESMLRVRERL